MTVPEAPNRIYLDSCILNRPADDPSRPRIRAETTAIEQIFDLVASGGIHWIASVLVEVELSRNPDLTQREDSLRLIHQAAEFVLPTGATLKRAAALKASDFGHYDAIHLCLAAQSGADWLLTVDDRFLIKAGSTGKDFPKVENPLDWVRRRKPWLLQT